MVGCGGGGVCVCGGGVGGGGLASGHIIAPRASLAPCNSRATSGAC